MTKTSQNHLDYERIKDVIEMDYDKKLDITFDDYFLFSTLESIKFFNKNSDDLIKNIVSMFHKELMNKVNLNYKY